MIAVRNAKSEEMAVLGEIGLAAWRKGIMPLVSEDVVARITADNPFLPFLRDMGPRVRVAVSDGAPAGLGACEHGDDYISDVWVSPDFEGRGIGSALLSALETEIAARGHTHARLHVAAANERALRLYQHRGYREIWRGTVQDAVLGIPLEKFELAKDLPGA